MNHPQQASPLPVGQPWLAKQALPTSGTPEMLWQCQPVHGLVQRWGQQKHFLTSLRSSHPSQARSHRQPKFPSFPESPAARGQPRGACPPTCPGAMGPHGWVRACRSVCLLSQLSRKAAVIYEPRTVLAECSGGLDYSFPEEAVCLEMAR